MKDRYLFRGKRIDNGEWVEGSYIVYDNKHWILPSPKTEASKHSYLFDYMVEVIHETVGKCTGLKDKNGKLIYDGDIVSDGIEEWKFIYSEIPCGFIAINNSGNAFSAWHLSHEHNRKRKIKIIGNVYDDKQLIQENQHEQTM